MTKTRRKKREHCSQWARRYVKIRQELACHYIGNQDSISEFSGALTYFDRLTLKSNALPPRILIGGPTSSGKSYLAETACEVLGCINSVMNMGMIAPESYKGSTITEALQNVANAGQNKKSILILDEVDKISKRSKLESSFKSIEYSMLSVLNGDPIHLSDPYESVLKFSTRRSLIIGMGVFDGISPKDWTNHDRIKQSLVRLGHSHEWVSRWTHFIYLSKIDSDQLVRLIKLEAEKICSTYEVETELVVNPSLIKKIMNSPTLKSFGLRSSRSLIHKAILNSVISQT